jgi:hypothetical protein
MRNFGLGKHIVPADEFSPYLEPDRIWPFYVIGAVTLMIVGIGVFIA